jgi:hypothetical protein
MTGQNISEGKTKGYKQDRPKYVWGGNQRAYTGQAKICLRGKLTYFGLSCLDPMVPLSDIFWSVLFRPFGSPLWHILAIMFRPFGFPLRHTCQNMSEGETKVSKQDRPKYVRGGNQSV